MLTQLIRRQPVVGYAVALLIGGFVTAVGVAGALTGRHSAPGTAVFLGFVAAVGALVVLSLLVEIGQRARRPRGRLGQDSSGRPATVFPFGPAAMVASVGVLVATVVFGVLGLLVAADAGSSGWAAVAGLVAAGAGLLLVPVLIGRVRPGAVTLSEAGIEHRRLGTSWRLVWDDLDGATPSDPMAVVPRSRPAVTHQRLSPFGWDGDVRAPDGVLGIETRHLAVDEQTLLFLLASYSQHPELRSQLGTAESLRWRMLDARS